jgi:hypothetical protein
MNDHSMSRGSRVWWAAPAKTIAAEDPAKVLSAPTPFGDSGLIVGIAKDLEGYLVEILQSASGPSAASSMDAGH